MKLLRVGLFIGAVSSLLAFSSNAHAQQLACMKAPGGAGMLRAGDFKNCSIGTTDATRRMFDIHVPASYTGTRAVALVLDLHGLSQSKETQEGKSGFLQKADQVGYVYVAAQGRNNSWNGMGPCCLLNNDPDLRNLQNVVAAVARNGRIDANQIFVTGFSNGASMSHTLACDPTASAVFAGAGMVSFQLSGSNRNMQTIINACRPAMPLPIIEFHGTADQTAPFNGAAGPLGMLQTLSARNSNLAWALIQGCNTANGPTLRTIANNTQCETYSGCRGGVSVSVCVVTNSPHNVYANLPNPTVADVTWDFWQANQAR